MDDPRYVRAYRLMDEINSKMDVWRELTKKYQRDELKALIQAMSEKDPAALTPFEHKIIADAQPAIDAFAEIEKYMAEFNLVRHELERSRHLRLVDP